MSFDQYFYYQVLFTIMVQTHYLMFEAVSDELLQTCANCSFLFPAKFSKPN